MCMHPRLVFETINSTNMAALSDSFVLDAGWHHMAVAGDNARRVVTFYLDGNQIVRSNSPPFRHTAHMPN